MPVGAHPIHAHSNAMTLAMQTTCCHARHDQHNNTRRDTGGARARPERGNGAPSAPASASAAPRSTQATGEPRHTRVSSGTPPPARLGQQHLQRRARAPGARGRRWPASRPRALARAASCAASCAWARGAALSGWAREARTCSRVSARSMQCKVLGRGAGGYGATTYSAA